MNVKEQHVVTGMSRDSAVSQHNSNMVYDARNIRISVQGKNNTLMSVTNERGTKKITLNAELKGTPIGCCVISDFLILFTHEEELTPPDHIYRITVKDSYTVSVLFEGDANFSLEHPIETQPLYETEDIQKVYWVDGRNQPRVINIVSTIGATDIDLFNFNRKIEMKHTLTVEKIDSGGIFPAGTIQYALSYFNKFAQETNIFEVTPMYYLSPKESGLAADKQASCSFKLQVVRPDSNFQYIRLYSIIRTTANATPKCRIVGDYAINTAQKDPESPTTIIDNGVIGKDIDATALLFIGGEELIADTITQKDNTLFLGNISLNRPSIGNLIHTQAEKAIKDIVEDNITTRKNAINRGEMFPNSNGEHTIGAIGTLESRTVGYTGNTANSAGPTGKGFYNYKPNNNRSSRYIKRFKTGESYRLGFIAQYKTGKWSEAIWIDDVKNMITPRDLSEELDGVKYSTGAWQFTLDSNIISALQSAGYVRVAPVVVYPNLMDRLVYAQGLLSPTVYNAADRIDGNPYAQASWFFRLFNAEADVTTERIKVEGDVEFYYDKATWKRYGCYASAHNASLYTNAYARGEIQCMEGPRLFVPNAVPKGKDPLTGATGDFLKKTDFIEYFNNYYFVDSNILTINSPEIDSSEELLQSEFTGLKVRVVGFSKVNAQATDTIITTENVGINADDSQVLHFTLNDRVPSLSYYADSAVNNDDEDNVSAINKDAAYGWVTYPWHRYGSLNNQAPLSSKRKQNGYTTRTSMLKHKIEATLWYGESKFVNIGSYKNLLSTSPQIFSDDQLSAIRLNRTDKSTVIYYGNIDKVLSASTPSKPAEGDIEINTAQYNKQQYNKQWINTAHILDTSDGYWIRRHWCKGKFSKIGFSIVTNTSDVAASMNYKTGYPIITMQTALFPLGVIKPVNVDTPFEGKLALTTDRAVSKDPIPIKYKSTPHLVFSLEEDDDKQFALPSFMDDTTYKASYIDNIVDDTTPTTPRKIRFWDDKTPTIKMAISTNLDSFIPDKETQGLFIGEVYREETKDFVLHRFGGLSREAFVTNNWVRCGEAVDLDDANNTPLVFLEGDTYFQRYDCLKTYPFTMEDSNSIIEMFSTTLETRVNLDFAYNKNKGMRNNTTALPSNFNLFNHSAYEQDNNFFTYHSLDYDRYSNNKFPSTITWSMEKQLGEDVDNWASIDGVNLFNMDGSLGEVRKLFKFNDNIYCLQDIGFSQLLFNSRVQIPTSDGLPIEISNGMKMQGNRYISNKIGCVNKWSFVESPLGVYWIDDINKGTYFFNGQLQNLSSGKGMQTWMNESCVMNSWNPLLQHNCWGFYNNETKDIIWVYKDIALTYSEIIGQYISFTDYGGMLTATSINGNVLGFTADTVSSQDEDSYTKAEPWELNNGAYNMFFDKYKPYWLTFISNSQPTENKIYNNLEWRDIIKDNLTDKPFSTFDHLEVWTEHQNTGSVRFTNSIKEFTDKQPIQYNARMSNLRKKFNVWRCQIPRDYIASNSRRARISNPWCYIKLSREDENTYRHEFTDLVVDYFM